MWDLFLCVKIFTVFRKLWRKYVEGISAIQDIFALFLPLEQWRFKGA